MRGRALIATCAAAAATAAAVGCPLTPDALQLTGGTSADGGKGGASTDGGCPRDGMVTIPAEAGTFCIDATEVTRAQYAQFYVAMKGDAGGQPPQCAWNTTFEPTGDWPDDGGTPDWPITYIDWCDAYAYCKWGGERLCGAIGGGSSSFDDPADTSGQWYTACSRNDARDYPYGVMYDPTACNVYDVETDASVPLSAVGSYPACVGGYSGIYDMAGNAEEWEDACQAETTCDAGDSGACDRCLTRGGSSYDQAPTYYTQCGVPFMPHAARSVTAADVGVRCCSN